ncbi:hypothetical protein BHE74_00013883 [Ensete ventricosum]|nr:hypothetical protein GW17_00018060 [Ensete ventricosum]RWW77919.1 hypothetical protein BHE74_00013883 [Ensete ventricosum]
MLPHFRPSTKNTAKKPQSRSRGYEGDRLFHCSSRRLIVTSWIRIVEGGRRQIGIEKGLRVKVLPILPLLRTPSPSPFSFDDSSSLATARLIPPNSGWSRSKSTITDLFWVVTIEISIAATRNSLVSSDTGLYQANHQLSGGPRANSRVNQYVPHDTGGTIRNIKH